MESHGHTRARWASPTYRTWQSMKRNPVCARWRNSFTAFLTDMGEKPDGYRIARIDSRLPFGPGNVEWAPPGGKTELRRAQRKAHHGHAWQGGYSPTYGSWQSMIQRCTNPTNGGYARYGGRGITVCERWRDFRAFLADMGERPAGTTIDRLDSDGNYEPGNCRWATPGEQARNRKDAWNDSPSGRKKVAQRDRCKYGHIYAEVGVYVKGQNSPTCKACATDRRLRYLAKRKIQ